MVSRGITNISLIRGCYGVWGSITLVTFHAVVVDPPCRYDSICSKNCWGFCYRMGALISNGRKYSTIH